MGSNSTHWVIIVFAILFGLGLIYTIVWMVIASVSPETIITREQYFIAQDVKRHFRFLIERGYEVSHLKYVPHHYAGWHFQLDSPDQKISIMLDQQERPLLAFGTDKTDKQHQIFLDAMIYHLTEGKVFRGYSYDSISTSRNHVFKNIAKLLKTYINQIERYSRDDFEKPKNELSKIQEQYGNLLVQDFEQQLKARRY